MVDEHRGELEDQQAPEFTCSCGKTLEFDAIEDCYFQFVHGLPKVG